MPTASNRLPMVPKLSSAASMPFPGATSSRAVSSSFLTSILRSPSLGPNDRDPEPRSGAQDHGVFEGPFSRPLPAGDPSPQYAACDPLAARGACVLLSPTASCGPLLLSDGPCRSST